MVISERSLWDLLLDRDFRFYDADARRLVVETEISSSTQLAWLRYKDAYATKDENEEPLLPDTELTCKLVLVGLTQVGKTAIVKRFVTSRFNPATYPTIGADLLTKTIEIELEEHELDEKSREQLRRRNLKLERDARLRRRRGRLPSISPKESVSWETLGDSSGPPVIEGPVRRLLKLECWDVTGQLRFNSVTPLYSHDADGVIVVYSVTDPESLVRALELMREIRGWNLTCGFTVVGNKTDVLTTARALHALNADRMVAFQDAVGRVLEVERGAECYEVSAKTGDGIEELFRAAGKRAWIQKSLSGGKSG